MNKNIFKLKSRGDWTNVDPASLPKEFLSQVKSVITESFKEKLVNDEFHIYGNIFPKEVVLACSLKHGKSIRSTTIYTSLDHEIGKDSKLEKKLFVLVDVFGSFFHDFFENGRQLNFEDIWSEYNESNNKFFVRTNRDNIELETQASKLLKDEVEED